MMFLYMILHGQKLKPSIHAQQPLLLLLPSNRAYHTTPQCWGMNNVGQLGLGDTMNRGGAGNIYSMGDNLSYVDLDLGSSEAVASLDCGNEHTCVLLTTGRIKVLCVCVCV